MLSMWSEKEEREREHRMFICRMHFAAHNLIFFPSDFTSHLTVVKAATRMLCENISHKFRLPYNNVEMEIFLNGSIELIKMQSFH